MDLNMLQRIKYARRQIPVCMCEYAVYHSDGVLGETSCHKSRMLDVDCKLLTKWCCVPNAKALKSGRQLWSWVDSPNAIIQNGCTKGIFYLLFHTWGSFFICMYLDSRHQSKQDSFKKPGYPIVSNARCSEGARRNSKACIYTAEESLRHSWAA